ncbi:hypothetical protein EYF80_050053 [Liparis tanakae]|uniref:Uncharacterized protein n=1 Tax=Liparis tanakae TaxID=230148 RepID=A0A4Z2FGB8_9TELE|nr:hypothetical protein EYF80_050053 [Liparis tanakae]
MRPRYGWEIGGCRLMLGGCTCGGRRQRGAGQHHEAERDRSFVQPGYLQQVRVDELGAPHAGGLVELRLEQDGDVLRRRRLLVRQAGLRLAELLRLDAGVAVQRRARQHHGGLRQAALHEGLLRAEGAGPRACDDRSSYLRDAGLEALLLRHGGRSQARVGGAEEVAGVHVEGRNLSCRTSTDTGF